MGSIPIGGSKLRYAMIDWKNIDWRAFATDKATSHSYNRVYPSLLNGLPDVSTIMEVGVFDGGSLFLWKSIFPQWNVVGIDISPKPAILEGHESIKFIQASAYCDETIKSMEEFKGQCSVVIDDGSHLMEHVCFFAKNYPVFLKRGGILIIEDIQNFETLVSICECLPEPLRSRSFVVDLRMFKHRADDIMLVAYNE